MIDVGQAIAYLDLDTSRFRTQLGSVWNDLRGITDSTQSLEDRMTNFGAGLSRIGANLTLGVTTPLIGFGVAASKVFGDFEEGINKISTLDTSNKLNIPQLKDDILALSTDLGVATSELNESMYSMGSAMGEVSQDTVKYVEVASKAAIAGFTDTNTAVDGLSTAMNIYGDKSIETMSLYADMMLNAQNLGKTTFGEMASTMGDILPIMSQLGLGMDVYSTSMAVLTKNGLQTSKATTGLKAAFSNIIKPTKDAADMAEILGLEFNAAAVQSKGLIGFVKEIKTAMQNAAPEYAKVMDSYVNITGKMRDLEVAGKQSSKEYKELTKIQKEYSNELDLLGSAADSPIQGFAKLFGSVEALNTMMVLASEQGVKDFDEILKTMPESLGLVQEGFDKLDQGVNDSWDDAMLKMQNTAIKFGDIVAPVFIKTMDAVGGFFDTLLELDKETLNMIVTIGGLAAALGPILFIGGKLIAVGGAVVGFVSTLGPMLASLGAVIAGTATPVGFLGTAVAALSGPLGLAVAGITALGIAGVALYKHFSQDALPAVELFGEGVSQATKDATQGFLEMNNEVHRTLEEMSISSDKVTQEMATSINKNISTMSKQVIEALNTQREESKNAISGLLTDIKDLQGQTSAEVLQAIDDDYNKRQQKIQENESNIKDILQKAADEQRELTVSEIQAINDLRTNIAQEGIQVLTESELEQKVILERMKENESTISAQIAAESVKNAIEKKEKVIQEAEEQYERSIAEIIKLRDESKVISDEQAQALIDAAKRQKDETIKYAEEMHTTILEKAKTSAGENVNLVDWETGEIKSKWTVFWEDMGRKADEFDKNMAEMRGNISKSMTDGWNDFKRYLDEVSRKNKEDVENIKNNFKDLGKSISDSIDGIIKGIIEFGPKLKDDISKAIDDSKKAVEQKVSSFFDVGKNIIDGIIRGVNSKVGELKATVSNMASSALRSVKSTLGIHSPSKVFEKEVGENISLGIAKGISNKEKDVSKALSQIHDRMMKAEELHKERMKRFEEDKIKESSERLTTLGLKEIGERYSKYANLEKQEIQTIALQIEQIEKEIEINKSTTRDKNNKKRLDDQAKILEGERKLLIEEKKNLEEFSGAFEKTFSKMQQDYERAFNSIESKQESLADKLKNFGKLVESFKEGDTEIFKLGNIEEQISMIERYGEVLEKLKSRGADIDVVNQVLNMSIEDAVRYGSLLLEQSNEDFERYMQSMEKKREVSNKVARDAYVTELNLLKNEYAMKMYESMEELPEMLGKVGVDASKSLFEPIVKGGAEQIKIQNEQLAKGTKAADGIWQQHGKDTQIQWQNMNLVASDKFNQIKISVVTPIEQAKFRIQQLVKDMESAFRNMKINIPKPKLPHISVSMKSAGKGIEIPDYSVSWYDRGGVFYGPSIIGVGEKRPEFVGALDDLKSVVSSALNENGGKSSSYVINFNGPITVRDDSDIRRLGRELGDYVLSQDRARGMV